MSALKAIALGALLPAALTGPVAAAATPMIALCTGDGQVHLVPLPGSKPRAPGKDDGACCIKRLPFGHIAQEIAAGN